MESQKKTSYPNCYNQIYSDFPSFAQRAPFFGVSACDSGCSFSGLHKKLRVSRQTLSAYNTITGIYKGHALQGTGNSWMQSKLPVIILLDISRPVKHSVMN